MHLTKQSGNVPKMLIYSWSTINCIAWSMHVYAGFLYWLKWSCIAIGSWSVSNAVENRDIFWLFQIIILNYSSFHTKCKPDKTWDAVILILFLFLTNHDFHFSMLSDLQYHNIVSLSKMLS